MLSPGHPLLRLTISLTSKHQSQFRRTLRLRLRSIDGTHTLYTNRHDLDLSVTRNEDGEVTRAQGVHRTFLISPGATEVELVVEIPDLTLTDQVAVTLDQGVRTRWTVPAYGLA
ncbi:MAG: hypothetical protein HC919_02605 [Oscillatoriales cyanobacterium SM2_2_1]|nr:hypothetical protein [Oscillatoriales cyanobacterium SM2_2_1]